MVPFHPVCLGCDVWSSSELLPFCFVHLLPSVQVGNDEAIEFYRQFGFEVGETITNYYQKLDVTDAVVLSKKQPFGHP